MNTKDAIALKCDTMQHTIWFIHCRREIRWFVIS